MTGEQILSQMKTGKTWPVYLLYGEELYLSRELKNKIIEQLVPAEERETSVMAFDSDPEQKEFMNLINSAPFFGSKNVIVINGTTLLKTKKEGREDQSHQEDLVKVFSNMPSYSHVILLSDGKVDKRKKLFKTIEKYGIAVEFGLLKVKDARTWLYKALTAVNRKMDHQAVEHLLTILSLMPQISTGLMQNELDKILLYNDATHPITKKELEEILSSLPEVSIFAMLEAACQKQTAKALILLQEQLAAGVHPLQIIALLARQVRMLCQAKEYSATMSAKEIAQKLGVPSFVSDKLIRQSASFTFPVLKNTLIALAEANRNFKLGSGIVLEDIIIHFCA